MARPTLRRRSPVSEAVIKLREALGDSQQEFAIRTGSAIATVARHETSRPPKGKALSMLSKIAEAHGQKAISAVFNQALTDELGNWDISRVNLVDAPRTPIEKLWVSAVLAILRNPEYVDDIPKAARVLKRAAKRSVEVLEGHKKQIKAWTELKAAMEQANKWASAGTEESK